MPDIVPCADGRRIGSVPLASQDATVVGCDGAGCGSGDPGRLVGTRVVEDRGEVLGGPFLADLAALQPVEVDRVPLEVAPGGGNAQQGALLRTGHDQADDDLVAMAEDVLHVGVQIGDRGDYAGQHPGDGGAAREVADRAGVELCVLGQVAGGVVAVVSVEDVLEECLHDPYVGRYGPAAVE